MFCQPRRIRLYGWYEFDFFFYLSEEAMEAAMAFAPCDSRRATIQINVPGDEPEITGHHPIRPARWQFDLKVAPAFG